MLFYNIEITCMGAATVVVGTRRGDGGRAPHSGSNWLELAKNKFTKSDFTSFSFKFMQIHITSVSGRSKHFILKKCQIVAGPSMIRQFHDLLKVSFLAGFCSLAQLCAGMTAAGSLLESPRDNKKRDKKSESRSMPPLDY